MTVMQDCMYICKNNHIIHSSGAHNVDPVFEPHEAYVLACNDVKDYALGLATLHRINGFDSDVGYAGDF